MTKEELRTEHIIASFRAYLTACKGLAQMQGDDEKEEFITTIKEQFNAIVDDSKKYLK